MELEWIEREVGDGEGAKIHMHYLVNTENDQCLATIAEPREGGILYVTDLRVSGVDRSWVTLEAAKHHCESMAEMDHIREIEEFGGVLRVFRITVPPVEWGSDAAIINTEEQCQIHK